MWYKIHGIEFEHKEGHGPIETHWYDTSTRRLYESLIALGELVKFQYLQKYDLIMLFGNEQMNFPSLLAVMVDDRHIITSTQERGSFVEMLNMHWKSRFFCGLRLHEVVKGNFV